MSQIIYVKYVYPHQNMIGRMVNDPIVDKDTYDSQSSAQLLQLKKEEGACCC